MSHLRSSLILALYGVLLWSTPASQAAEIDRSRAAGVMAAYLRHIAIFTNWPEETVPNPNQTIRIGLIGGDPNGVIQRILEHTRSGAELLANGRPIRVVLSDESSGTGEGTDTLTDCALIFVSEGSENQWVGAKPGIQRLPIVTVSEMQGFADLGGMIELFVDRRSGKVRMKVNLQAAHEAGISFSSYFLGLESVTPVNERKKIR